MNTETYKIYQDLERLKNKQKINGVQGYIDMLQHMLENTIPDTTLFTINMNPVSPQLRKRKVTRRHIIRVYRYDDVALIRDFEGHSVIGLLENITPLCRIEDLNEAIMKPYKYEY